MAPPPPPPANANDNIVDRDVWLACAVPLSRLPAVGDEVYYFPHGHAEQCPAHLPAPLPTPHLFPCTVTAISFGADDTTDEVFAKISLKPGPHRSASSGRGCVGDLASASASASHHHPPDGHGHGHGPDPNNINNPHQQQLTYFAKTLTPSDANNGGGFSIPRYCAEHILPRLDLDDDPPVQNLVIRDTTGKPWHFRHIYRGTPRRHLLTTGWSRFVNAKLLVAGDVAVFIRRPDGGIILGLRRLPIYPLVFTRPPPAVAAGPAADVDDQQPPPPTTAPPPRNARARVPPQEVMEAARLAAVGSPFTVTYFPRQDSGEFVIPRNEVEDALAIRWEPGTQVRMQFVESEESRRMGWANGHVKAIHQNIWRALQIDWDDSSPLSSTRYVNAWQVEFVAYPPLPKRLRIFDTIAPLCPGDVSHTLMGSESQAMAMVFEQPIPAGASGMQGARHTGTSDETSESSVMLRTQILFPQTNKDLQMLPRTSPSASSEILNPEAGSPPNNSVNMPPAEPPVQVKSIKLFGATITPHVPQSATDGGSEAANGVADENAEKDV